MWRTWLLAMTLAVVPGDAMPTDLDVGAGPRAVITGPYVTNVGNLIELDAGQSIGGGYAWEVLPLHQSAGHWLLYKNKRVLVFAPDEPGRYRVILAVAQQGQAAIVCWAVIVGDAPNPDPEPKPDPKPQPEPGKRVVLIIEETSRRTPVEAAIYTGDELREFVEKREHTFRLYDKDQQVPADMAVYRKAATGQIPPILIIGAEGKILFAEKMPSTVAGILDTIKKHGG